MAMKIFSVFTPAHERLLRDWFLPGLPGGFEAVPIPLEIKGSGDFLSEEFLLCIREKISLVIASIKDNAGEWIIWSDIDILVFDGADEAIRTVIQNAGETLMFFQRERKTIGEVNTGFILIRCCEETGRFFAAVGAKLDRERGKNEQAVINEMLADGVDMPWGSLPAGFVARTHGWPPARGMYIYHANYTLGADGVGQKIKQFRAVLAMRKYGLPARLYFCALRAWEKSLAALGKGMAR
jgi:hypothetical protein